MSLETVSYSPGICVRCGGADGYELGEGDVTKIYLNQTRNAEFPEWVEGTVVGVAQASATDTTKTYTVQYETADLEEAALLLSSCDITSLICVSCCEVIQEYLNALMALNAPIVDLSYSWSGGLVVLQASAYSTQVGVIIAGYEWFDPAGEPLAGDAATLEIPDSDATSFLGGLYMVTVTDSAGLTTDAYVYVNPTPLKFRTATAALTTGNSTVVVALNTGETIASAIQTTAGSGVLLESITYSGLNATLTFTNTPAVASVSLQLLIQKALS